MMHKAYSISLEMDCHSLPSALPRPKPNIKIEDFLNERGNVVAKDLIELWFPKKKFNVFLSHSHQDENLAIKLSEYLEENFGLTTFIDSQVWSYADDLLKIFDNEFCRDNSKQNYNYKLRNMTTAHIHNMLSVALTEMMDKTECILFLNTENSVNNSAPNLIKGQKISDINITEIGYTYSSWIYLELKNLITLRKKDIVREIGQESLKDSISEAVLAKDMKLSRNIEYDIHKEIKYLPKLNIDILNTLSEQFKPLQELSVPELALDLLYAEVPMEFPNLEP